jgi:hypothetical protein
MRRGGHTAKTGVWFRTAETEESITGRFIFKC